MRKINTAKQNHIDYKTQLLQQANNVTELFKDSEYAADFEDEIIPQTRTEVSPPVTPEKTRFNPDQIVDIVTFIEHPFFCNLKPHPWQRLILKCFYMGQEGNTNIFFNDVPQEERTSCKGCVWEFVKKNEIKFSKESTSLKWETDDAGNMKTTFNVGDKKYNFNYGILRYFNVAGSDISNKIGCINKNNQLINYKESIEFVL